MNEVRQNWSSLKTPRSSIVVSGNSTWYDVPAPVIVHNRQFIEECSSLRQEEEEALYQNDVEAKLNCLNKEQPQQNGCCKKRHSSSIELTAATSVKTDADGVPTITFSFFRTDEQRIDCNGATDVTDGAVDVSATDQLYDFPRSSRSEANVTADEQPPASHRSSSPPSVDRQASETAEVQVEPAAAARTEEIYDVVGNNSSETSCSSSKTSGWKGRRRSLKWRRSLGKLEDLVRPAAGHSGSHSDSEAPAESGQKWPARRKLGKAWGRMRTWLSEERSKIGEVVARHARAQAVGARLDDVTEESTGGIGTNSGSYDLTRARLRHNSGCQLPMVEEFGLAASVSVDELDGCEMPPSRLHHPAIKKTASSDDILAEDTARERLPPATSYSLERLCSEDEEADKLEASDSEQVKRGGGKKSQLQQQRRFGKGGLIKRRMLGSIRGLIASTHLLHELGEEVFTSVYYLLLLYSSLVVFFLSAVCVAIMSGYTA